MIGVPPLVVDLHEHFFESLLELFVGSRRRRPFLLFPVQLLLQIGDFVLQTRDRRSSTILVLWWPKAERERKGEGRRGEERKRKGRKRKVKKRRGEREGEDEKGTKRR